MRLLSFLILVFLMLKEILAIKDKAMKHRTLNWDE